jgi:5-formyltetrahydrofolate cyclo-ligase
MPSDAADAKADPRSVGSVAIGALTKGELRRVLRARRRELGPEEQAQAAAGLCARLCALPALARPAGRLIAAYVAIDGEIDPGPGVAGLVARGARVA